MEHFGNETSRSIKPPRNSWAYFSWALLTEFSSKRLVATIGSNSNLKKVNRKAILDVDVKKACNTVIFPEAPMALRLQSNLL